jgi:hypothetical protein
MSGDQAIDSKPPVAKHISLEMDQGDEVMVHLDGSDPNGHKLTYEITKPPRNGAYALDPATGHVQYRPSLPFHGLESMTYIVVNSNGLESQPADIVIDVHEAEVEDVIEITIEVPADPNAQDIVDAIHEFNLELDKLVE